MVAKVLEIRQEYQIGALRIKYYLERYHGIQLSEATVSRTLNDHVNRDAVKALYDRLTKDGVDVWLDKEKLVAGQDWELESCGLDVDKS